jgi:hypothetical protein
LDSCWRFWSFVDLFKSKQFLFNWSRAAT